eukprot:TRINITY_DN5999_c0_g1_i9.p1 TRINITY_DN5999_c0_g1~~TRINITY_DN5999_c0_g1_i9.p1  ORF type:complete len:135 (-),score=6.61 TRINITY_DN5999_c0_g1_i9:136-540(-)
MILMDLTFDVSVLFEPSESTLQLAKQYYAHVFKSFVNRLVIPACLGSLAISVAARFFKKMPSNRTTYVLVISFLIATPFFLLKLKPAVTHIHESKDLEGDLTMIGYAHIFLLSITSFCGLLLFNELRNEHPKRK